MHGAGNDYIYVDTTKEQIADPAHLSLVWSDRHKGIGGDGLVLIGRDTEDPETFTMRIFNNDGSEARMCGNASRCIGKYLYEYGLTDKREIRLRTLSGIKILKLNVNAEGRVEAVTVDMDEPQTRRLRYQSKHHQGNRRQGIRRHVCIDGQPALRDFCSRCRGRCA